MKKIIRVISLKAGLLAAALSFTSVQAADQFWISGENLIDGVSFGANTDNDLVDTGASLVVTNGGSLLASNLVVGKDGAGTLKLYAGSAINVSTLLLTNNTLISTNSVFNFNGGTLTTSNAVAATASSYLVPTNTTFGINGTWNMLGGVNQTAPVQPAGSPSSLVIGFGGSGLVVVSNALWNFGNSSGLGMALQVGNGATARGTLWIDNGGVVSNAVLANSSAVKLGTSGSSSNSIVITNGGIFHVTGPGDLAVGFTSGTSSNNSVIVAGNGSALMMNGRKITVGAAGSSSGNSVILTDGALATNVYSLNLGSGSTTAAGQFNTFSILNGARYYLNSGTADSFIGNGANAANDTLLVRGATSIYNNASKSLYVGGGGAAGSNCFNNFLIVDAGTATVNAGSFLVGGTNCFNNAIIVTNGGQMIGSGVVGNALGATNNWVQLGGNGGGLWNVNGGNVTVGIAGSVSNSIILGAGGVLSNAATINLGAVGGTGSKLIANGGTITARPANSTTITNTGDAAIVVQSGGITFDDLGQSISVRAPIMEDAASLGGSVTKTGAGTLTLTNANTFSGGLYVKSGRVISQNSRQSLGGNGYGQVFLGDTSGSANVTLDNTGGGSFTNAITVQSGNSGTTLIVGNTSSPNYYGALTNNNPNLQLSSGNGASTFLIFRGTFAGSANMTVYNSNTTPGTVVFNAVNGSSYFGNIVVSNSVLRHAGPNNLVNSAIQVNAGAANDVQSSSTIAGLNDLAGSGGIVVNNSTTGNRTLTVGGAGTYSFNGTIVNGGAATATNGILGLTKSGAGTQTLGGVNTYSGPTTISGGTLALAATGSINNSTNITLNAGGTFDVSAISAYTLSTNLNAAGTGLASGSTAAVIRGAAAGSISFGAQTVALGYAPASLTGDSTHPALVISQGALDVNGSVLIVTNASPLGAGDYLLITNTTATIAGSFAGTNLAGLILAPSTAATVINTGNAVILQVISTGPPPQPVITSAALVGGSLVFSGTNGTGTAGGTYYVIGTTNLTTPVSGWNRVSTNTYGPGGAFSVTNPVTPSTPQEFFMLEQ